MDADVINAIFLAGGTLAVFFARELWRWGSSRKKRGKLRLTRCVKCVGRVRKARQWWKIRKNGQLVDNFGENLWKNGG